MSVFNGAAYLRTAIDSILAQTFRDFEFIIVDDASTDDTPTILNSYEDSRIVLLRNTQNEGLAASLNRTIDTAHGTYIVRMDADDISTPDRLAVQIRYLNQHQDIVLVGSYARIIGSGVIMRQPTEPGEIATSLLFRTSVIHPTAVFRRDFLNQYHLRYNPSFLQTQDYELFTRIARLGKIANIPRVLLHYRQHNQQTSSKKVVSQMESARIIMRREFKAFGMEITEEELDTAIAVKRYHLKEIPGALVLLEAFLLKIDRTNQQTRRYDTKALRRALGEVWLESVISLSRSGVEVREAFLRSTLRRWITLTLRNMLRIARFLTLSTHIN